MENACGQRGEWAAVIKKKVNKNSYDISSTNLLLESFLKFHVVVVQNNGKETVLHVQSWSFAE